jgi:site-specific recombinase XerD
MIEEMKLRNFSPATQESYVYAVSRLARYHNKAPDRLNKEDIRAFLVHLTVERKLSPNSLTGYCSGLRFFYNETLGWDETKLFIPPRKKSSSLPEVFSPGTTGFFMMIAQRTDYPIFPALCNGAHGSVRLGSSFPSSCLVLT